MYKLTVVAGTNRGTSYALQEGVLTIGRQSGNSVVFQSSRVSKRHCSIEWIGTRIIVKDLGSSNGTFVNGVLIRSKELHVGDRISIGDFVLELSQASSSGLSPVPALQAFGKALQVASSSSSTNSRIQISAREGASALSYHASHVNHANHSSHANQPPKDVLGKLVWYFEHGMMPVFYNLNLKYEWKFIVMGLLALFAAANIIISIYPLLESNRDSIIRETGKRARFMARQIADQNAAALAAGSETKTEIGNVENATGVRLALLVDLDHRIIAPSSKMNQYLASGSEARVALNARNAFREGKETGFFVEADSDTVVAIEPVKVLNPKVGKNVVVAMAVVSIDSSLATPDYGEIGTIYSEAMIVTGVLGAILILVLYRLTLKPFQVLNEDLDKVLKGDVQQVSHVFKIEELDSLWDVINSAVQRIPKSDTSATSAVQSAGEENARLMESCIEPIKMICQASKLGCVIFDFEKKILHINAIFEELSGIRSDFATGQDMSEVARDQAMRDLTEDLLGRCSPGSEGASEDFDFSGVKFRMAASAFGTVGGIAKGYILTAVRAEE